MNSKYRAGIVLSLIVGSCFATTVQEASNRVPLVVINVLSEKYYEDCHILGSINVPVLKLKSWAADLPKDTHIVVYCAHSECSNGPEAWSILKGMGFGQVSDYAGGSAAWYQAGLPVEGACMQPYLKGVYSSDLEYGSVDIIETFQLFDLMKKYGLFS